MKIQTTQLNDVKTITMCQRLKVDFHISSNNYWKTSIGDKDNNTYV